MGLLSDLSPAGEFQMRNCLETPIADFTGTLNPSDLLVHRYPYRDEDLPIAKQMQLKQCHNTDRLAVTE